MLPFLTVAAADDDTWVSTNWHAGSHGIWPKGKKTTSPRGGGHVPPAVEQRAGWTMRGEGPRSANPLQIEAKVNTMAALYCCRRRAARPEGVASVVGGDERHTLAGTPTCCSSHPTMHEIIVTLSHRRFALWQPPSPSACHASGPWASVIKCAEEGPRSKFEACLLHPHQRQAPPWPLIRRHLLVVLSSPWFLLGYCSQHSPHAHLH